MKTRAKHYPKYLLLVSQEPPPVLVFSNLSPQVRDAMLAPGGGALVVPFWFDFALDEMLPQGDRAVMLPPGISPLCSEKDKPCYIRVIKMIIEGYLRLQENTTLSALNSGQYVDTICGTPSDTQSMLLRAYCREEALPRFFCSEGAKADLAGFHIASSIPEAIMNSEFDCTCYKGESAICSVTANEIECYFCFRDSSRHHWHPHSWKGHTLEAAVYKEYIYHIVMLVRAAAIQKRMNKKLIPLSLTVETSLMLYTTRKVRLVCENSHGLLIPVLKKCCKCWYKGRVSSDS